MYPAEGHTCTPRRGTTCTPRRGHPSDSSFRANEEDSRTIETGALTKPEPRAFGALDFHGRSTGPSAADRSSLRFVRIGDKGEHRGRMCHAAYAFRRSFSDPANTTRDQRRETSPFGSTTPVWRAAAASFF